MAILKIRDNNGNVTEIAALKGTGISKIEKTATNGLIDTYTITLTDGTTSTFTVTNGTSGSADIVIDTALSGTSTNPVQNKAITARVNKLQGDLNDFIAEVPDLIRQRTLCVGLDERGEQTTHSVTQIYQHVQDGGQVVLLHPDYPETYFALIEINESSAYFGGKMSDDNLIWRFEYTDDGIYEYESSIVTGEHLQTIDITQPQQWESNTQNIARTNIGLDSILTVDASNNYRSVGITDMTFSPTNDMERRGSGVGIYLGQDTLKIADDEMAEVLEFYGLNEDERVILSNIAPGQQDSDAATVGQLGNINGTLFINPEGPELSRGICLTIDNEPETGNNSNAIEVLSFYGQNGDEQVRLRNIAPGAEDNDAATVGQVNAVAEVVNDMNEDVYNALQAATWAEDQISTNFGPKMSQVQTGLGSLADRVTELEGIDVSNAINTAISAHNTNTSAHADIREEISQLSSEKVDKSGITLGVHTDGYVYIFVNGSPQGNGLDIKADVVEGDVFGYVDDNNVIVLDGALADGTYYVKYKMKDGSIINIGNMVLGEDPNKPNYTNLLPLSQNADGAPFVGENGEKGYKVGYRISSNGGETALSGAYCSGFMPVTGTDKIYIKPVVENTNALTTAIALYDANKTKLFQSAFSSAGYGWVTVTDGVYCFTVNQMTASAPSVAYFRFSCGSITDETIVTVNEPITEGGG